MSLKSLVLDLLRWDNAGTEPLSGRKDTGRAVAERIPAGEYNWFKNQFYLFLSTITNTIRNSFSIDLPAYYGNTKLGDDGQNDADWTASGGGVVSQDTVNVKIGTGSVKLLEPDNASSTIRASKEGISLDLTVLNNGKASIDDDFISIIFYVSDKTKFNDSTANSIRFDQAATYIGADMKFYNIPYVDFNTGWNYLKIKKSDFGTLGTGAWDGIQTISFSANTTINAQNEFVSLQLVQLIKKDPVLDIPNQLQRFEVNDFEVDSGEWFTGLEFGKIVLKELSGDSDNDVALQGTLLYSDFIATASIKSSSALDRRALGWRVDGSNRIVATILSDVATLTIVESGSPTAITENLAINANDLIDFKLNKNGSSVILEVYKNRVLEATIPGTTTITGEGVLTLGRTSPSLACIESASITEMPYAAKAGTAEIAKDVINTWLGYVPTLTFTGTPPGSIATVARYRQIGNKVDFNISLSSSDGNGATDLRVSLPVTPKDNNSVVSVSSQEKVDTTWSNPLAYIDDDASLGIQFRAFSTATDTVAWEIIITGSYEV